MTPKEKAAIIEEAKKHEPDIWSDEYFPYWEKVYAQFEESEEEKEMKNYYYWIDTMPTWTNEEGACALVRGELDENEEKDRDTEDVILEFTEADCGIDRDDPFRIYPEWDKIDAYIESKLGFLPDYEVN